MTVSIIVQKFDQNAQQRVSEVPKKKLNSPQDHAPGPPLGNLISLESNLVWNLINSNPQTIWLQIQLTQTKKQAPSIKTVKK